MARSRESRLRTGVRAAVTIALLMAIGGLFGVLATQLKTTIEADAGFVAVERQGVTYLRPLIHLIDQLTVAQSTAVRGRAVDNRALKAAVAAVSAADSASSTALSTKQRWSDLRTAIERTTAQRPTGRAALDPYREVVTLAAELARKIGDTSNLLLDPMPDSYYLTDATILQLPTVLAAAGLVADHAYLADGREATEETLLDLAVARYRLATATDALSTDLRKSLDATDRSDPRANVNALLDAFRGAADQVAPPAMLRQALVTVNAGAAATAAAQVHATALSLADAVLPELDALLHARQDRLTSQWQRVFATVGAAAVLGIVLFWWSTPARARREELAAPDRDDTEVPADVAALSVQMPVVDPRDLLAEEELVHIGRAVRAQPKESGDDAW